MHKILISNIGFGEASPESLKILQNSASVFLNEAQTRYTEKDFIEKIADMQVIIAGTEKITKSILERAENLKLIARLGSGVDNIDLDYARAKKINISYTPDAPSQAVPEFTLALILNLLKGVSTSDRSMHQKIWKRPQGRMLSSMKVGILGAGRIGTKILELIHSIAPSAELLFFDPFVEKKENAKKCELNFVLREADLISIHLPLNSKTKAMIGKKELQTMKQGSYLINTSRGGIVDEKALYQLLKSNHLAGAALDVFEVEPYQGNLVELENCILTSHIGSLTREVRSLMEEQVVEEVLRFIKNEPLLRPLAGFNFYGN